jgi:formamidopyrimidine-DNA glycosylase
MPELPEVEVIARGLRKSIMGKEVSAVKLARRDMLWSPCRDFVRIIKGSTIASIGRKGKYLLLRLDNEYTLLIHLGMTGQFWLSHHSEAIAPHTHLIVRIKDSDDELRLRDPRRFGGIALLKTSAEMLHPRLARVGPDPFEMDAEEFARRLSGSASAIKAVMLKQDVVSGLGNIYVDESLWAARIHPLSPASRIRKDRLRALHRLLLEILERSIAFGGSSISDFVSHLGSPGYFQNEHRVYGKSGQPCQRCNRKMVKLNVAGRGTTVCNSCQRPPAGKAK